MFSCPPVATSLRLRYNRDVNPLLACRVRNYTDIINFALPVHCAPVPDAVNSRGSTAFATGYGKHSSAENGNARDYSASLHGSRPPMIAQVCTQDRKLGRLCLVHSCMQTNTRKIGCFLFFPCMQSLPSLVLGVQQAISQDRSRQSR